VVKLEKINGKIKRSQVCSWARANLKIQLNNIGLGEVTLLTLLTIITPVKCLIVPNPGKTCVWPGPNVTQLLMSIIYEYS
jgi:hypothetical protein